MKRTIEHIKRMTSSAALWVVAVVLLSATGLQAQDCNLPFSCVNDVQVSLDTNCVEVITPGSILREMYFPASSYTVVVKTAKGKVVPNNIITRAYLGQRLEVSVKLNPCGKSCWGYAWIEDKYPPVLRNCDTVTVACDANLTAGVGVPRVTATDACGPVTVKQLPDVVTKLPCGSPYIKQIERPWMATDSSGNISTCVQVINVRRNTIADVRAPRSYDDRDLPILECGVFNHYLPNWAPDPAYTGFPTGINCENIQFHYSDITFDVCGKGKKVYRSWEVIDWCTGRDTSFAQTIKILDTKGPVCTEDPNQVVVLKTDPKKCTASYKVPDPKATDCSKYSYIVGYRVKDYLGSYGDTIYTKNIIKHTDNTYTLTSLPTDTTIIIYKLTDECGNVSYCSTKVLVKDKESPSANCEGYMVVSLRDNGWAEVTALALNSGSEDNCGIVKYEIKRLDTNCPGYPQDKTFRDRVNFCCEDVNPDPTKYIKVVLRVTDAAGNTNECISNVKVQDKLAPEITCPADVTLECYVDFTDLTKTNGSATAKDNCMATIQPYQDTKFLNNCGIGYVLRKWTATDRQGLMSMCTQRITIIDSDPFSEEHITFPADTTVNVCVDPQQLSPEYLDSKPKFHSKHCADLAVSYTDDFYEVDNACKKILRHWRVINWCTYNASEKNYYTHTQKILVHDIEGPVFISGCVDRTIVSREGDCEEEVHHRVEANDKCTPANLLKYTWEVDLFSNQTIDRAGVGPAISDKYPVGRHKMTFRVLDNCGNESKCTYTFLIKDDKKPVPICHGELVWVLDKNGRAEIWASDFNLKSEDFCGTGELTFAFDERNTQKAKTFTCADVPNGVSARIPLRMYVFDSDGNFEYCSVILNLQDSPGTNACTDNLVGGISINGKILNNKLEGVDGVNLVLEDMTMEHEEIIKSQLDGSFAFTDRTLYNSFMLKPEKMDEPNKGVNTLDMVYIQRHILSVKKLETPYQLLAADVNNDKKIDISDLVGLRKIILGVNADYGTNRPWRFIPYDFTFEDPYQPFDLVEYKAYDQLLSDQLEQDFLMFKVGDVDANYSSAQLFGRSKRRHSFNLEQEGNDVVFRAGEDIDVSGLQMAITADVKSNLVSGKMEIDGQQVFRTGNEIRLAWTKNSNLFVHEGEILFVLKNADLEKVGLSEQINAEIYNADYETYELDLKLRNGGQIQRTTRLSVYPNPFRDEATIEFYLNQKEDYELKIFDQQGRLVYRSKQAGQQGLNRELLPKEKFGQSTGVYLIRMETSGFTQTQKVIITD